MFQLKNTPGRTCIVDEKEFLFFSGYSYLGMNHVKEFKDLVKEGIDKYGILFPSSRISNTRLKLYEAFENRLSKITGLQDSVSFSSGYLAGKTISAILSTYKNILVAPGTHPAIKIEPSLKTSHKDFNGWKDEVTAIINSSADVEFVLLCDSIDVLNATVHNFSFLENINPSKNIILLIDDSHGMGILGKKGQGIIGELPKNQNLDYIISYSLSKAFNIEGGAVSCSKNWAAKLRQHPNYTASTAISPSLIHAFMKAKKLYSRQRAMLIKNILIVKKQLPANIKPQIFNIPIFICENENAASLFYNQKIVISSFGYPDPSSEKINRIVINALHSKKDLKKLCSC
jgi:7-keto-8-aminopelargonate synthetase-like enzyme